MHVGVLLTAWGELRRRGMVLRTTSVPQGSWPGAAPPPRQRRAPAARPAALPAAHPRRQASRPRRFCSGPARARRYPRRARRYPRGRGA